MPRSIAPCIGAGASRRTRPCRGRSTRRSGLGCTNGSSPWGPPSGAARRREHPHPRPRRTERDRLESARVDRRADPPVPAAPGRLKRNPHYASAAPMRCYQLARVLEIEASEAWQTAATAAQPRKTAAAAATATKRAALRAHLARVTITVPSSIGPPFSRSPAPITTVCRVPSTTTRSPPRPLTRRSCSASPSTTCGTS